MIHRKICVLGVSAHSGNKLIYGPLPSYTNSRLKLSPKHSKMKASPKKNNNLLKYGIFLLSEKNVDHAKCTVYTDKLGVNSIAVSSWQRLFSH